MECMDGDAFRFLRSFLSTIVSSVWDGGGDSRSESWGAHRDTMSPFQKIRRLQREREREKKREKRRKAVWDRLSGSRNQEEEKEEGKKRLATDNSVFRSSVCTGCCVSIEFSLVSVIGQVSPVAAFPLPSAVDAATTA